MLTKVVLLHIIDSLSNLPMGRCSNVLTRPTPHHNTSLENQMNERMTQIGKATYNNHLTTPSQPSNRKHQTPTHSYSRNYLSGHVDVAVGLDCGGDVICFEIVDWEGGREGGCKGQNFFIGHVFLYHQEFSPATFVNEIRGLLISRFSREGMDVQRVWEGDVGRVMKKGMKTVGGDGRC